MIMEKKFIRKSMLNIRKNMHKSEVELKSNEIFNNLISKEILIRCNNYLLYSDFNNEVKTGQIIDYLLKNKKSVYLPTCDLNTHTFKANRIYSIDFLSKNNCYGIKEPVGDNCTGDTIECALIPGIAFGTNGMRLGFGGGYYDRYLAKASGIYKVGLCYEFQLCDYIECKPHDIAMDFLVTEKRVMDCRKV